MAKRNPHYNTWSGAVGARYRYLLEDERNLSILAGEINSEASDNPLNEALPLIRRGSIPDSILENEDDADESHDVKTEDDTLKLGEGHNAAFGDTDNTEVCGTRSGVGYQRHEVVRPDSTTNTGARSNQNKEEIKQIQSTGASVWQTDRDYDVFLLHVSDRKEFVSKLTTKFDNNNIKWRDYEKDFSPSHSILYDLSKFLFSCKRTVVILSPGFYHSHMFMYFLETAVKYCVDHGKNALIPILVDTTPSDIPTWLNIFKYFKSDHRNWSEELVEELKLKVQSLICKGHAFHFEHFSTVNSVQSEPPISRGKLSKTTESEMKIWFKKKFGQLPAEFQNNRSSENTNIEEALEIERGMHSEIMFARRLRQEKKKVYDSAVTFRTEDFDVMGGDVLEICETCEDKQFVRVRNSRGQIATMPVQDVLPNVFALPKLAMDLMKYQVSTAENDAFETELRLLGKEVFMAIDSSPLNSRHPFQKNDIFAKIDETGKYANVKNCRNEMFLVEKRHLKEKSD